MQIASIARKGASIGRGAENINAGINLAKKLSQLETAQQSAVNIRLLREGIPNKPQKSGKDQFIGVFPSL